MIFLLDSRVLTKTKDYLEVFARFKKKENVSAVERLLNTETNLVPFEKSQLGWTSIALVIFSYSCMY